MRRRAFIAGLGGVAAWPVVAGAEQMAALRSTLVCLLNGSGFRFRLLPRPRLTAGR
jgi:hypothetical protein